MYGGIGKDTVEAKSDLFVGMTFGEDWRMIALS